MVVIKVNHLNRIAATITSKRKSLGMSQEVLAEKSGISQAMITLIESGKRLPGLITLLTVLNELQMVMRLEDEYGNRYYSSN
jgi:transcriptional regulator with XRE-family HTH domain